MLIKIGGKTESYLKVLGLSYPFDESTLRSAFRKCLFEVHPDHSNDPKANEKTIKVNEAYSALLPLSSKSLQKQEIEEISFKISKNKSSDIFALYDNCGYCSGSGKIPGNEWMSEECDCSKAGHPGEFILACNKCQNGKFTLRSGRVVDCLGCHGTGIFIRTTCKTCRGTGRHSFFSTTTLQDCLYCSGTGQVEVKPFNPVIPKGGVL